MPYTHHSHSGQFCPGHAKDSLEDVIQTAIEKKMEVFALTEHMPRHDEDQYPEEAEDGWNLPRHTANQSSYYTEAQRLRSKYSTKISLPIGFEGEWIRPSSADLIRQSLSSHAFDYFIGSVHHVHTIPIDYDHDMYVSARNKAGGTDEKLFEDYFDAQFELMEQLKPPVIGHFDLIRLKSEDPDVCMKTNFYGTVWQKIKRNLDYAASYGALLEINTSGLRKGLREPYPAGIICQEYAHRGGSFVLSDDSHGIQHVASNYEKIPNFLDEWDIQGLCCLEHTDTEVTDEREKLDPRFPNTKVVVRHIDEIRKSGFWEGTATKWPQSWPRS